MTNYPDDVMLYDRLTSEQLSKLKERNKLYPITTGELIEALKTKQFIIQLTVGEAMEVSTILDMKMSVGTIYESFGL